MNVPQQTGELTLGPVLFNWPAEQWRDFYFRIADEAPVGVVYLGEVICSKRAPLFAAEFEAVAARLIASGKRVVFSTLAEVMSKADRRLVESVCAAGEYIVEANDASALPALHGRPHHIGPFINVYNERTAAVLARAGACNIALPPEMPAGSVLAMCEETAALGVGIEVQVFGRLPLALSARCYHARAHGRTKDTCQLVCERDPDGMALRTLEGQPFLAVNGVQTLSNDYLSLIGELADLRRMGVRRFRLSPHSCDMVAVASTFRSVLDGGLHVQEAQRRLEGLNAGVPFSNGFYYGKAGHRWYPPAAV